MEFLESLFYPKEIYNLIRYKMGFLAKVEQVRLSRGRGDPCTLVLGGGHIKEELLIKLTAIF